MIYQQYPSYYGPSFPRYPNSIANRPYFRKPTEVPPTTNHHNPPSNAYPHKSQNTNNMTNHQLLNQKKSLLKEEDMTHKTNVDTPFFEIFGIKLYFDDILLICLIFFLYTEGVEDQYLFIALILLLLS